MSADNMVEQFVALVRKELAALSEFHGDKADFPEVDTRQIRVGVLTVLAGLEARGHLRMIPRTGEIATKPWPADCPIQGGARGIVSGPKLYRTAFVEASPRNPNTFLRGEGATVPEAEAACWAKYERMLACPGHPDHGPFEARGYTNGAGFCARCGTWFPLVLPEQPEDPNRVPNQLDRALRGDDTALAEIVTAVAATADEPNATSEKGDPSE